MKRTGCLHGADLMLAHSPIGNDVHRPCSVNKVHKTRISTTTIAFNRLHSNTMHVCVECMRCISGMYRIAIDYSRLPSIPTWSHCGAVIAVQSMAFQWSLEQSKDARPRTPTLPVLVSCQQKSKLCSALSGCMIAYH